MRPFLPQIAPYLRLGWRWPQALTAMRHRNFRLYFFGQLISLTGSWMQTTAQQWLAYRLTGSQLSLGVITFASFVPVLILSLFMGVIVDRLPRRRLILWTQTWFMVLAFILAILTYTGRVTYTHLVVLSLLLGVANALDMPARQAFMSDLVERDELLNAIALNSSLFNGTRIIGPALGGLAVAAWGEASAFLINAVSFLAVLIGLFGIRVAKETIDLRPTRGLEGLKEGVSYLRTDRQLLALVTMVALFSLMGYPYNVLLPALARDSYGLGAEGFGGLTAAMGVGALVAGVSLALRGEGRGVGRQLIASRWIFSGSVAALALAPTLPLAMAALVVSGYAVITQLAITNTLIQKTAPDHLRGRIVSGYTWALGGFWPLGALLMGFLGDRLSASAATGIAAAGSAVLALLGMLWFPETAEL
ncbi:MAG TPA: MFS transporter [Anaerolineales bacterium]|nr:MFS transporter [Anaerolineales bacterium]